jgi:rod shape-determining protein MreC
MFIVLGKADIVLFERLRVVVADVAAPILQAVAQPMATAATGVRNIEAVFAVYSENQRLHDENARLLQWQEVARRLEAENTRLRSLVKFTPESPVRDVAARVIGNSGGAFARNVLVNAGSSEGVARGQAAATGEGLVGRIAEVGDHSARVLLVSDLNSRIPVVLDDTRERAVMAGDNSDQPRLLYLRANAAVKVGERIVTGGAGGVFPPGIPVGVVASIADGVVRVEPYAELSRLEFVRIVDFGLEGVLPQSAMPLPKAAKGAKVIVDPDMMR